MSEPNSSLDIVAGALFMVLCIAASWIVMCFYEADQIRAQPTAEKSPALVAAAMRFHGINQAETEPDGTWIFNRDGNRCLLLAGNERVIIDALKKYNPEAYRDYLRQQTVEKLLAQPLTYQGERVN